MHARWGATLVRAAWAILNTAIAAVQSNLTPPHSS